MESFEISFCKPVSVNLIPSTSVKSIIFFAFSFELISQAQVSAFMLYIFPLLSEPREAMTGI